jgi:hypothetical protein
METIKTKVHINEILKDIKTDAPWLGYETFQDLMDHVTRIGVISLEEGIVARTKFVK